MSRTTPYPGNWPDTNDSGAVVTEKINDAVSEAWKNMLGVLTSVAGTNTITANAPVTLTAYDGMLAGVLKPANTNTGAVTININGLGAKSILDATGSALAADDLIAGKSYFIYYDGTAFRVLFQTGVSAMQKQMSMYRYFTVTNFDGATVTLNTWYTYPLNDTALNDIPGASLNTGNGQMTLPPGKYKMEFDISLYGTNFFGQVRLWDATAGVSVYAIMTKPQNSNSVDNKPITGIVYFELTTISVLHLQLYMSGAGVTLGEPSNVSGINEIYGGVFIEKLVDVEDFSKIHWVTSAPSNAVGTDNDVAVDYVAKTFYQKVSGVWTSRFTITNGTNGTNGTDGKSILNGSGIPDDGSVGVNGDFYMDMDTLDFYGPKSGGLWGTPIALIGSQIAAITIMMTQMAQYVSDAEVAKDAAEAFYEAMETGSDWVSTGFRDQWFMEIPKVARLPRGKVGTVMHDVNTDKWYIDSNKVDLIFGQGQVRNGLFDAEPNVLVIDVENDVVLRRHSSDLSKCFIGTVSEARNGYTDSIYGRGAVAAILAAVSGNTVGHQIQTADIPGWDPTQYTIVTYADPANDSSSQAEYLWSLTQVANAATQYTVMRNYLTSSPDNVRVVNSPVGGIDMITTTAPAIAAFKSAAAIQLNNCSLIMNGAVLLTDNASLMQVNNPDRLYFRARYDGLQPWHGTTAGSVKLLAVIPRRCSNAECQVFAPAP